MYIGRNGRPSVLFRNMSSRIKSVRAEQPASLQNARDADPAPSGRRSEPADGANSPSGNHERASARGSREINSPLLFSNNPQPMMIYDPETLLFLDVNAAALHQYGYTREEILSLRLTDIRPAEEIPRMLEAVRKGKAELTFGGHWRHQRKNGEVFDVEITTHGIHFAGCHAILMAAPDVSARRAAEEKIAEHDAYIHALTENNPLATVAVNPYGRVQLCHPAFETLFGYKQSEIVGTEIDLLLAPAREAGEALDLTKRATKGEVVRAEGKRRRSDGSMVDVQILGVPLMAQGKQIGSFGMYEDITERRRAEDAQHRAEERLRLLFENAVEGIFQTTPQGRILSLNPALARMCGYADCAEMMREVKNVDEELYADRDLREEFKRRIEEQGVVEQFEYQLRRKDGAKIWVSENARAIRNARGKIACYEGTVEDITSKKRAELERQIG